MKKKCTTFIYLQRFNKILVTLYIVHMVSFLFILYTDLYLCLAGNLWFFIYGRVSFCFPFIDFYLWRVTKEKRTKKTCVLILKKKKSMTEREDALSALISNLSFFLFAHE